MEIKIICFSTGMRKRVCFQQNYFEHEILKFENQNEKITSFTALKESLNLLAS